MKKVIILGVGEIGSSIYKLYDENKYKVGYIDLAFHKNSNMKNINVLHICIPFNKYFIETVKKYIKVYNPNLTIINSTIPVLTTYTISTEIDNDVVHSPCMGRHPNLTKSFKTFTKIIAGYKKTGIRKARKHFKELGIKTIVYKTPEESEMAKLISTTYYGWNIYFMQKVYELCEEFRFDFDDIYTKTNKIYNEGYTKLGKKQFVRPVLKWMGNGIGKHCLIPNAKILYREGMFKKIAKLIISLGKAEDAS